MYQPTILELVLIRRFGLNIRLDIGTFVRYNEKNDCIRVGDYLNTVDFFHNGVAFLPSNEPDIGDVLLILGKNGERSVLRTSPKCYLQQLARLFGVDLTYLRDHYGQAIGKRQQIPLPLAHNWTLIPLQVRIPKGNQDTFGWVVKQAIDRIDEGGKSILLKGDHQIPLLHLYQDMRRILREAQLVELQFQLLHQTPGSVNESKEYYVAMS
jgi:hypothetical protein